MYVLCNISSIDVSHYHFSFFFMLPRSPRSTLFPYTTLFRSVHDPDVVAVRAVGREDHPLAVGRPGQRMVFSTRSEEHTSELQSRFDLVCRLLLEKKR